MRAGLVALVCVLGCDRALSPVDDAATVPVDAAAPQDLAEPPPCEEPNLCGDCDPGCRVFNLGPPRGKPFPLGADKSDPGVDDSYVVRDPDGNIVIDPATCRRPNHAWIAQATDWGRGTISKIDATTQREAARYFTVTCGSLPSGNSKTCDGRGAAARAMIFPVSAPAR
ncbi:MAG: hypothetical protein EXR72_23515 [Myxococcales bacterium]|nr:hypothetical protein [Myxococcales bacterium]